MSNVIEMPFADSDSPTAQLAGEVRAHLARRKIPTYRIHELLGGDESRGYWQRRVSGTQPFDIEDLARLSGLLDVPVSELVKAITPRPSGPGGVAKLPDLDSNQEPIGYESAAVRSLDDYRATKVTATRAVRDDRDAIVSRIVGL